MTETVKPGSRAWLAALDARCDAKSWPQPMPRPQGGKAVLGVPGLVQTAEESEARALGRFLAAARKEARERRRTRLGWMLETLDDAARYAALHGTGGDES